MRINLMLYVLTNFAIVYSAKIGSLSWNNKINDYIYIDDDNHLWLLIPFKFDNSDNNNSQPQIDKVSCLLNDDIQVPKFIKNGSITFNLNTKIEVRLDEKGCIWITAPFQVFSFKNISELEKVDLLQYEVAQDTSSQIVGNGDVVWSDAYSLIYLRKDGVLMIENSHNQVYFEDKYYSAIEHISFDGH